MARKFLTAIELPGDPGAALHATSKQYVDGRTPADPAAGTAGLRTLGTGALQACAGDDARLSDARIPTGAAGGVLSGSYPNPGSAAVVHPPVTVAYAASLTPDAAAGNYRVCTATGDLTLNPPTSPTDGQMWRLRVIASGAQRVVTLASGLALTTGITSPLTVPSGKRGDVGLLYEAGDGWTVLAATAQT